MALSMDAMKMEYKGIVMNYGVGAKMQYPHRMIIMVPGTTPSEAKGFVGSTVSWPHDDPKIFGRITRFHGVRKGYLLATFKRGLPGDSIGKAVKIIKNEPKTV
jgi:ribosomal protein L35AE/L33A